VARCVRFQIKTAERWNCNGPLFRFFFHLWIKHTDSWDQKERVSCLRIFEWRISNLQNENSTRFPSQRVNWSTSKKLKFSLLIVRKRIKRKLCFPQRKCTIFPHIESFLNTFFCITKVSLQKWKKLSIFLFCRFSFGFSFFQFCHFSI